MIVIREKEVKKTNRGNTYISWKETTIIFQETEEDWIAKIHRACKKTIGPDGAIIQEKEEIISKELNPKNEYVKNNVAETNEGKTIPYFHLNNEVKI